MTEAELYQKQVETCKQVQNMINELYISKDKIRKLMKKYKKLVEESEEKEYKEWKNMNDAQKTCHNILKNRWTNYYNAYKELLGRNNHAKTRTRSSRTRGL